MTTTPAGEGPNTFEVRPIVAEAVLLPGQTLHTGFRVDPTAGTIAWGTNFSEKNRKAPETSDRVMGLPGRGIAPELHKLVIAHTRTPASRGVPELQWCQLLMVDANDAVLARSHRDSADLFEQRWPIELFAPLRSVGIDVGQTTFRTNFRMQKEHPGADPHYLRNTNWTMNLIIGGSIAFVVIVLALLAFLTQ